MNLISKYFPSNYEDSVFAIDYEKLYKNGYRGIIFDVDNTLVLHGHNSNKRVDNLFKYIYEVGFKTVLLTDNDEPRVNRFNKNIKSEYICEAGKPNPAAYDEAVKKMQLEKSQVIVIGDQVFKDILAANYAGLDSILVKFLRHPNEKWIGKRRYVEYAILAVYKFDKKHYMKLGDISLKKEMKLNG